MQIEEGKFYITRVGATIGPAKPQPQSAGWPWHIEGAGSFTDDGRFNGEFDSPLDLIRETGTWRDVPVTMEFLANLFGAYRGADGHNLVVAIAANVAKQKLG